MDDNTSTSADTEDTASEHDAEASVGQELTKAKADAEQNRAAWMRTQADFDNYRKRIESETAEWIAFGKHAAFAQIVPILDSLEQALVHAPQVQDEKYSQWKNGLDGIVRQVNKVMADIGIEKLEPVGKKFDPNFHEAVREVPGPEDGIVAEQYQTGYVLNGKLIRPAQVAITKKNAE